ncbi:MAG: hypothetical protein IPK53_11605 [bacterium]|nr:hypothetical protein [bacterium]
MMPYVSTNLLLVRTDNNGDTLWSRTYGGVQQDVGYSFDATSTGGFILVGHNNSVRLNYDMFVVKTDDNGNELWSKVFGGAAPDHARSVLQTSYGFAIIGETSSYGAGGKDAWLVRVNNDGDSLSSVTYGGVDDDGAIAACNSGGDNIAIAGFTSSFSSLPGERQEPWLVRVNSVGTMLAEENHPVDGGAAYWESVRPTADGGFLTGGRFYRNVTASHEVLMQKVSAAGPAVWARTFGGLDDDRGVFATIVNDSLYFCGGYSNSFSTGSYEGWLIKSRLNTTCATCPQTIVQAEYFLDADPGQGFGMSLPVVPDDVANLSASVTAPSAAGLHTVGVRTRDDQGHWSLADTRLFYVLDPEASNTNTIVAAEYFFNADPGQGQGTPIAVSPDETIILSLPVDVNALPNGLHSVTLRLQDDRGFWSIADSRLFYKLTASAPQQQNIVAAEYFFNADPGQGQGTPIAVSPGQQVSISELLDLSALQEGLNSFALRLRDSRNLWSIADTRLFYITYPYSGTAEQLLAEAEYFINVDPGQGYGVTFLPDDGVWDESIEEVSDLVADIPAGMHLLGIRFRDNRGNWSGAALDTFVVGPLLTILPQEPITLQWQDEGNSPMTYIWRGIQTAGPFSVIDSTTAGTYVDNENPPAPASRLYFVTQQLAAGATGFRLPSVAPSASLFAPRDHDSNESSHELGSASKVGPISKQKR